MCFSNFPTESGREALETIRFLEKLKKELSLFILGQFDLTSGSLVAKEPAKFGVAETWTAKGDSFGSVLFFRESAVSKRDKDLSRIDHALSELSSGWSLRHYPWAGALSTAHTMLWYNRYGRAIFRKLSTKDYGDAMTGPTREVRTRYDLQKVADSSGEAEEWIWSQLIQNKREVSRAAYERLAAQIKPMKPSSCRVRYGLENGIEVIGAH
jgi:hypothetical protein